MFFILFLHCINIFLSFKTGDGFNYILLFSLKKSNFSLSFVSTIRQLSNKGINVLSLRTKLQQKLHKLNNLIEVSLD